MQIAVEIRPDDDLYHGRLHEITAPTLFIHGKLDPRTEPGELDAVSAQLPHAEMRILDNAAHSPHSESAAADLVTQIAREFLAFRGEAPGYGMAPAGLPVSCYNIASRSRRIFLGEHNCNGVDYSQRTKTQTADHG